jgi:hypothetical protein
VAKVALGEGLFSDYIGFPYQLLFHDLLQFSGLSSEAGTRAIFDHGIKGLNLTSP